MNWNILLFASKWALIALIYFVLFMLVVTVRREFGMRIIARQPQAATIAHLRVINPGNNAPIRAGELFDLTFETSLGAASDNQVVLSNPFVSNHHARLRYENGSWWLEDLDSRNGTLLNGRRCVAYQAESLAMGANIQMGDLVLQVTE